MLPAKPIPAQLRIVRIKALVSTEKALMRLYEAIVLDLQGAQFHHRIIPLFLVARRDLEYGACDDAEDADGGGGDGGYPGDRRFRRRPSHRIPLPLTPLHVLERLNQADEVAVVARQGRLGLFSMEGDVAGLALDVAPYFLSSVAGFDDADEELVGGVLVVGNLACGVKVRIELEGGAGRRRWCGGAPRGELVTIVLSWPVIINVLGVVLMVFLAYVQISYLRQATDASHRTTRAIAGGVEIGSAAVDWFWARLDGRLEGIEKRGERVWRHTKRRDGRSNGVQKNVVSRARPRTVFIRDMVVKKHSGQGDDVVSAVEVRLRGLTSLNDGILQRLTRAGNSVVRLETEGDLLRRESDGAQEEAQAEQETTRKLEDQLREAEHENIRIGQELETTRGQLKSCENSRAQISSALAASQTALQKPAKASRFLRSEQRSFSPENSDKNGTDAGAKLSQPCQQALSTQFALLLTVLNNIALSDDLAEAFSLFHTSNIDEYHRLRPSSKKIVSDLEVRIQILLRRKDDESRTLLAEKYREISELRKNEEEFNSLLGERESEVARLKDEGNAARALATTAQAKFKDLSSKVFAAKLMDGIRTEGLVQLRKFARSLQEGASPDYNERSEAQKLVQPKPEQKGQASPTKLPANKEEEAKNEGKRLRQRVAELYNENTQLKMDKADLQRQLASVRLQPFRPPTPPSHTHADRTQHARHPSLPLHLHFEPSLPSTPQTESSGASRPQHTRMLSVPVGLPVSGLPTPPDSASTRSVATLPDSGSMRSRRQRSALWSSRPRTFSMTSKESVSTTGSRGKRRSMEISSIPSWQMPEEGPEPGTPCPQGR
ncbi:hypothetical protein K458DRAFT_488911 [Lentithecium fluviatile CBS 122367]|uniref:Uncharacterized protein n=1 Tax=Lentithecium fluviatile CBS 122367 TaxID=1168545 RepID=A0A6G1IVI0_9PLEO|nr:hypothetical protein K458DRAFT_488911 [Lentithecium fluviatile CBS 122367]